MHAAHVITWRHVSGRACSGALDLDQPEVADLEGPVAGPQDVQRLEVAVDDGGRQAVKILHGTAHIDLMRMREL